MIKVTGVREERCKIGAHSRGARLRRERLTQDELRRRTNTHSRSCASPPIFDTRLRTVAGLSALPFAFVNAASMSRVSPAVMRYRRTAAAFTSHALSIVSGEMSEFDRI